MHTRHGPPPVRDRERDQVEAAIQLVAGGRFPRVLVANLAHTDPIARELVTDATRRGVRLSTTGRAVGTGADIVVTRR